MGEGMTVEAMTGEGVRLPSRCFGREPLVARLVEALSQGAPPPVLLLGPPGIGKSHLARAGLAHPRVAARYGARRFLLALDGAPSAEAALELLAGALGLGPRADLRAEVGAALARGEAVLALDGFEAPWEREREATEALLAALAAVPGLALLVAMRGAERPRGAAFGETLEMKPLEEAAAAELFCSIAGEKHRHAPGLAAWLARMEGVPRGITLLAQAAEGLVTAEERRWSEATSALMAFARESGREAQCRESLGDLALGRSKAEEAARHYEAAGALYQQVVDTLGEANCIKGLGDVALERREHTAAARQYEAALPLYQQADSGLGEANCLQSLGDVALGQARHEEARGQYEAAEALYQRVGDVRGEANCLRRLGDLALAQAEEGEARRRYEAALSLYERLPEPYSQGSTHRRLARLAEGAEERQRHVAAAREAWRRVDRADLLAELAEEFGAEPPPAQR